MVTWEWTREEIAPEDVLVAARTIEANHCITMCLTERWIHATRYLEWARAALKRGNDDGWDAAAGWAKRAVCRRMDGILLHNYLGCFLGKSNKDKADYLADLKVPGLALLRDLVIDPRNEVEHAYTIATEEHACRAYDAAELFLCATKSGAAKRKISRQRKTNACGVEWARVSACKRCCASRPRQIGGANGLGMRRPCRESGATWVPA